MPDFPEPADLNEAQRLKLLQKLLLEISLAVQDLSDEVQCLWEKCRHLSLKPCAFHLANGVDPSSTPASAMKTQASRSLEK
jgi:hypothetical protein